MTTTAEPYRAGISQAAGGSGRAPLERRDKGGDPVWARLALAGLLAATAALYLVGLGRSGWANDFYAAAVQAGTRSWKAMFFGSFDASNFITVDKPPASLWVSEVSARIFGLNSWSLLVPQALEGVAAVGLLYTTVRRWFGPGRPARGRGARKHAGRRADVPVQQSRCAARAADRRGRVRGHPGHRGRRDPLARARGLAGRLRLSHQDVAGVPRPARVRDRLPRRRAASAGGVSGRSRRAAWRRWWQPGGGSRSWS